MYSRSGAPGYYCTAVGNSIEYPVISPLGFLYHSTYRYYWYYRSIADTVAVPFASVRKLDLFLSHQENFRFPEPCTMQP